MSSVDDPMLLALVALGGAAAVALISLGYVILVLREASRRLDYREAEHQGMMERLQEKEYRLRAIFESEPECVNLQAADGTVLEINPAGLALVEADRPEDIVGKCMDTLVAPEFAELYRETMRRVFAGDAVVCEFRAVTLKDSIRWMETHAVPLRDAGGTIYALLGITRDVSEHMLAEEQTRRHQTELARVARMSTMGEMATGIAHELNQPLAAIANFARGCLRRVHGAQIELRDLVKPLEEICEQAERAGEVISHVRDFVRKREPQLCAADINQIVRNVAKFAEIEARQHDATLRLVLARDMPQIWADPIMLEQVIGNLVRNSIEAMHDAGSWPREIAVHTGRGADDGIDVEIRDTGPGIDGALIEQVFDQFFSTKPEGVGMGLSISRSIVDSHGGSIAARSLPGGGATFTICLPAIMDQADSLERSHSLHR
jgi:PAS domain S-box-containing protein